MSLLSGPLVPVLLVVAAFLTGHGLAKQSPCQEGWEQCLAYPPKGSASQYAHFKSLINAVRGYRLQKGLAGSLYTMDITSNDLDIRVYERMLGALFAMTDRVSPECNPTMITKYQRSGAGSSYVSNCQDACAAAKFILDGPNFQSQNGLVDSVNMGCYSGRRRSCLFQPFNPNFPQHSCLVGRGCDQFLVVALQNSPYQQYFTSYCDDFGAGVSVRINPAVGDPIDSIPMGETIEEIVLETTPGNGNLAALEELVNCISFYFKCNLTLPPGTNRADARSGNPGDLDVTVGPDGNVTVSSDP